MNRRAIVFSSSSCNSSRFSEPCTRRYVKGIPKKDIPILNSIVNFLEASKDKEMKLIPGILLAAGSSERFGSEKLLTLLPWGERLFERALKVHLLSQISPLIVVVSPNLGTIVKTHTGALSCSKIKIKKRVARWYSFSSQWGRGRMAINEDFREGMSSSIKKGISCLKNGEKENGILISLADLPLLTSETINLFINTFFKERTGILVPVFNGTTGHPVIYDNTIFKDDITAIKGDVGLRSLIEKYPKLVKKIPWHDDSVIWDIDTPQDLERL
jgi:molybdenum cofactor cytidylyltransferase